MKLLTTAAAYFFFALTSAQAEIKVIDTDGGMDEFTAGCLIGYANLSCTGTPTWGRADSCASTLELVENYTRSAFGVVTNGCSGPLFGSKIINCSVACGGTPLNIAGACVPVAAPSCVGASGLNGWSAKCECGDRFSRDSDGGISPFVAGCIADFRDSGMCAHPLTNPSPDKCENGKLVENWLRDPKTRGPLNSTQCFSEKEAGDPVGQYIDCNEACPSHCGKCQTKPINCYGIQLNAAYCDCTAPQ